MPYFKKLCILQVKIFIGGYMKIKPIFDRVVLKLIENKEQTSSGIYIPESSSEKPHLAEVIAIGDDKDMKVKPGDRVSRSSSLTRMPACLICS